MCAEQISTSMGVHAQSVHQRTSVTVWEAYARFVQTAHNRQKPAVGASRVQMVLLVAVVSAVSARQARFPIDLGLSVILALQGTFHQTVSRARHAVQLHTHSTILNASKLTMLANQTHTGPTNKCVQMVQQAVQVCATFARLVIRQTWNELCVRHARVIRTVQTAGLAGPVCEARHQATSKPQPFVSFVAWKAHQILLELDFQMLIGLAVS
jgi:hypothetical protein